MVKDTDEPLQSYNVIQHVLVFLSHLSLVSD